MEATTSPDYDDADGFLAYLRSKRYYDVEIQKKEKEERIKKNAMKKLKLKRKPKNLKPTELQPPAQLELHDHDDEEKHKFKGPSDTLRLLINYIQELRLEFQPTKVSTSAAAVKEEKNEMKKRSAKKKSVSRRKMKKNKTPPRESETATAAKVPDEEELKLPASESTPPAKEDNRWSLQEEIAEALTYTLGDTFPAREEEVSCSVSTCTKEDGADYLCTSILQLWPQERGLSGWYGPKYAGLNLMDNLDREGYGKMMDRRIVCGPGFLKFTISREWIVKSIQKMLTHGIDAWAPKLPVKRAVIDFFSRNIHMGHLRSAVIGDTLARMLKYSRVDVLRRFHDGNHLDSKLKTMMTELLIERFPTGEVNDEAIVELEGLYKESKKRFDEDAEFRKRAQQGWDRRHHIVWLQICKLNRERYQKVYQRMGVHVKEEGKSCCDFDIRTEDVWREMRLIMESEGDEAILTDGQKLPLVDLVALWHAVKIVKADWILRVTDVGKQDNIEMCITAAKRAGWIESDQLHCPFSTVGIGLVHGDDFERFQTLGAKVVNLGNLLDEAKSRCKAVLVGQGKADEWTSEELEHTAEALGYGAVKHALLKNNRLKSYTFSFDQILNGEGNTAVYLQYTHARICSIIRKSSKGIKELKVEEIILKHEEERVFGLHLLRFTEVLNEVCTVLMPHILCDYLYDLCTKFNSLHPSVCQANKSCDEAMAEILLCEAAVIVMEKCFYLLGITPIYKIYKI